MESLRLTLFFLVFATVLALHHCREDPLTVEDEQEKHHHLMGIDEPMLFSGRSYRCAKRLSCKFNRKRTLGCFCCSRKTPSKTRLCFNTFEDCKLTCRPEIYGESGRGGGMGGGRMGRGGMGGGMAGGGQAGFGY